MSSENVAKPRFDQETFDELRQIFPNDRVRVFVDNLNGLLAELASHGESEVEKVEFHAHKLASRAGILGCAHLSDLAIMLEDACRNDGDIKGYFSAVVEEGMAVEKEFDRLLGETPG